MEFKKIAVSKLTMNTGQIEGVPANPRQWTQADLDRLAASIEETPELLDARGAIVVPHKGKFVVLGGNMRLTAAKKLGLAEMPCAVLPEDTPAEKIKEIVVKDNGAFGAWDFDALANEWDDLPLTDWGVPAWETGQEEEAPQEVEEDDFNEETDEIETRCKKGDIWQLGEHRLMCGDSTDAGSVALLMNGEKADMLLTDPPYNVDYSSKNDYLNKVDKGNRIQESIINDKMADAAFGEFLNKALYNAASELKAGGAFYVWTAQGHAQIDIAVALDKAGMFFRQQIIWVKNNFVLGRMDYQGKHEPCFYGWKGGAGHFFRGTRSETTVIPDANELNIDKMKKDEMKELLKRIYAESVPVSIINENKPLRSSLHPTMKPVTLFGRLITNSTQPNENILDLFGGSGTTLIAAEQLGRKCYMMELDEHYCDVIIARWEKLTGQEAKKIN